MKKVICLIFVLILISSLLCTVYATEIPQLTEEEVFAQIANNTATISHEVRPLNSFTQEEIEQNPDLQYIFNEIYKNESRSINTGSAYGNIYTTTVLTNTLQEVVYRSYPKVTFCVVDVGTASSSDIYSTFKVIEAITVDGELETDWQNMIRYKDVAGTMGCGVNTAFTNDVVLSGNSSGLLSGNIEGFINFVTNVSGYSTVNQIMSAFDSISYTGSRVSSRDITSEYVRVVGSNMDNEELFSDAHNLTIQSSISTIDSAKTANQSTIAVSEWTFDVYFSSVAISPTYSNQTVSVNVDYLVNVK